MVKQKQYDPESDCDVAVVMSFESWTLKALLIVPISKSAAAQRAGRAGRTQQGKCYRLYSREFFEAMEESTKPEIQRTSLVNTILCLKQIGL